MLLVLDDGTAVPCHSHILTKHSAVFCNMFSDLAQHEGMVRIPLPEFTEAQCSALLAYLRAHDVSSQGAAFATQDRADRDAATAVARFAHTYDAPHVLRHVEAYLTTFMGKFDKSCRITPVKPGTPVKAGTPRKSCTFEEFVDWGSHG